MRRHGVDAVILPSTDPHQSEYVAERWRARSHFSGFTGSAGTAVVTLDGGGLWTDSRYFVAAPRELARTSGLTMHRGQQGATEYIDWIAESLPDGATVAVDGRNVTAELARQLTSRLEAKGLRLRTELDLVEEAWPERPDLPATRLFAHDVALAGRSATEKLDALRDQLREAGLTHALVSALDEIAWLLNVRASDIEANPLAIAYLLVAVEGDSTLFTEPSRIDDDVVTGFGESRITVRPYGEVEAALQELPASARIGIDDTQVSHQIANLLAPDSRRAWTSPLRRAKAIKNATEIEHIRAAHVRDGVALVRAFRWLEHELRERKVRECEFVDVLARERGRQEHYFGESFAAIVGFGANGALPHYRSIPGEDAEIEPDGVLLVDSGGQYLDGTTDITRTFGLGRVTQEQRTRYTLVLKGHIALARAVFPVGTRGIQLDTLARQYLWEQGLDFGHGTGHGVGFFLNVHEGPQGFAPALSERGRTGFEAGMLSSNEPGYYREGAYGIRIENLVLAVPAFPGDESAGEGEASFLRFETVTYYPIDLLLLEPDLLTEPERAWVNAYHAEVFRRLSPKLDKDERRWLKARCAGL